MVSGQWENLATPGLFFFFFKGNPRIFNEESQMRMRVRASV